MDVIRECAEAWERLVTGKVATGDVSMYVLRISVMHPRAYADNARSTNTTVAQSAERVDPSQIPPLPPHQDLPPEKIDASIDKWFFISGASA